MLNITPLYWLLDLEAYNYDLGVLKNADMTGRVLILSHQLWSILREDKVYSMLIGPGYFKGIAESGNRRIEIKEHISALMFDPTALRYDEPVPLVDVIKPEVIDPLGAAKREEIMTVISDLVVEKGNILAGNRVAQVRPEGAVPKTAHYTDVLKKISVSYISGVQRARFILGGTNRPLYQPLVEWFNTRRYSTFDQPKIMSLPFGRFADVSDIEVMSNWMIVEKAGIGGIGLDAFRAEYEQVMDNLFKHTDSYIFQL
ncbi:MAG: hypothetical protein ACFFEF_11950 [Candidatus Thorarchaeota archaeon]